MSNSRALIKKQVKRFFEAIRNSNKNCIEVFYARNLLYDAYNIYFCQKDILFEHARENGFEAFRLNDEQVVLAPVGTPLEEIEAKMFQRVPNSSFINEWLQDYLARKGSITMTDALITLWTEHSMPVRANHIIDCVKESNFLIYPNQLNEVIIKG